MCSNSSAMRTLLANNFELTHPYHYFSQHRSNMSDFGFSWKEQCEFGDRYALAGHELTDHLALIGGRQ